MRISDWSSDVCCSDLSKLSPNLQIFPAPDVINAALALSDPATALNPFRTIGGPFAPPDVIRAFFLPENGGGRFADFGNALWGVNGYVKGPLFQVPAGQVAGLLGAEYQREKRSEEHTSELQSLMRHSYAVFCLK